MSSQGLNLAWSWSLGVLACYHFGHFGQHLERFLENSFKECVQIISNGTWVKTLLFCDQRTLYPHDLCSRTNTNHMHTRAQYVHRNHGDFIRSYHWHACSDLLGAHCLASALKKLPLDKVKLIEALGTVSVSVSCLVSFFLNEFTSFFSIHTQSLSGKEVFGVCWWLVTIKGLWGLAQFRLSPW